MTTTPTPTDAERTIQQSVDYATGSSSSKPSGEDVVVALLTLEKRARAERTAYRPEQLEGTWRLRFITGTRRSRQKAGVILGAGRFLPAWIAITITYQFPDSPEECGAATNAVQLGGLHLTVSGPTKFHSPGNILAFDFTQMRLKVVGMPLYQGYIRNGQQREQEFPQQSLKHQAFFTYFWVGGEAIAARGRGGGLAIWTKIAE
jgi:hypothetical protein